MPNKTQIISLVFWMSTFLFAVLIFQFYNYLKCYNSCEALKGECVSSVFSHCVCEVNGFRRSISEP